MTDVSIVPLEKLAKKPAAVRFHSLDDDGALTIMLHRAGADSSELLNITFRTFTSYRVTRFNQSPKAAHGKSGKSGEVKKAAGIRWFRTFGSRHIILTEDRLFEITSTSKPQCSIVAVKQSSDWLPTVPSHSTTWSDLLKHLESVLGTDD